MPTTRSRVDCGLGLTMLSFWPTMRLSSVDLPAFGFADDGDDSSAGHLEDNGRLETVMTRVRDLPRTISGKPLATRATVSRDVAS